MNSKRLATLFKVNLLYANPQVTDQYRRKGKSGKKLTAALLRQYLLLSIVFVFTYGMMFITINLADYPGFFTFYLALFTMMAFTQSVSIIYNVFYESHDLADYLPLPFKKSEIFFAKFGIVALTLVPFVLPILSIFIITSLRDGMFLPVALVVSLILFLLFFALVFTFFLLVVSSITQTKVFLRHKAMLSTTLMIIATAGMIGGIFFLNNASSKATIEGTTLKDIPLLYPFYPFYQLLLRPLSLLSVVYLLGGLVLLALLLYVITTFVVPKFYRQVNITPKKKIHKQQKDGSFGNLGQQLLRYNLGLIKNPTLLMQFFSASILLPCCFLFPIVINNELTLSGLSYAFVGAAFVIGIVFSYLTLGPTALVSVLISLDKENFTFIKSLPLSLKGYLKAKLNFALFLQGAITSLLLLAAGIFLDLPLLLLLFLLAGNLFGLLLGSWYYFYRDYRLLTLNWTTINQLFTRGGGNFTRAFILLGTYLVGAIVAGAIIFLTMWQPVTGNLVVLFAALIAATTFYLHYRKVFWRTLS